MFTTKELNALDTGYFVVLEKTPVYVRLMSRSTLHFWKIYCPEVSYKRGKCLIQHSHNSYDAMHNHGYGADLSSSIKSVKQHDSYQLLHRKPEVHRWDEYMPIIHQ